MPTADIVIYHIFGTKNNYETLVEFKGATVKTIPGKELDQALAWAKAHGYTHYRHSGERKPLCTH